MSMKFLGVEVKPGESVTVSSQDELNIVRVKPKGSISKEDLEKDLHPCVKCRLSFLSPSMLQMHLEVNHSNDSATPQTQKTAALAPKAVKAMLECSLKSNDDDDDDSNSDESMEVGKSGNERAKHSAK